MVRHKYFIAVIILQIFVDFDVERFNHRKLSGWNLVDSFRLKSQTDLQPWRDLRKRER